MIQLEVLLLALLAGGAGSLIGGTQTFIMTGFVGILSYVLEASGVDVTFFNDYVLNTFFLPCIIFNGAVVSTAYSAKYYDIRGVHTSRSLAFTKDIKVILMGCLGGGCGYIVYALLDSIGFPADIGAFSVLSIGLITRLLFNQENKINMDNLTHLKTFPTKELSFQLLMGLIISMAMSYFAYKSKLYTIGFSISALSLMFGLTDPAFPATHHTTLVAGYAVMQTGSVALGVVFGVISHMMSYVFGEIFNTDCGTHLDPPAVPIALLSFILFTFF